MIKFQKKIDPVYYHKKQNLYPIYMHNIGESNKQKRMQILTQDLNINNEYKRHSLGLINFMYKPYAKPEQPQYLRSPRFNNHMPFQILIELTNCSVQVDHNHFSANQSIILDVDMIYNFQKIGDRANCPGKKVISVGVLCQLKFVSSKNKVVSLCKQIRILLQKETKAAFNGKEHKKSKEKLYLFEQKNRRKKISGSLNQKLNQKNESQSPILMSQTYLFQIQIFCF